MVLSLSSRSDRICFDTSFSITLCESLFFRAQASHTPIRKMAIFIIIKKLEVNKHATD